MQAHIRHKAILNYLQQVNHFHLRNSSTNSLCNAAQNSSVK